MRWSPTTSTKKTTFFQLEVVFCTQFLWTTSYVRRGLCVITPQFWAHECVVPPQFWVRACVGQGGGSPPPLADLWSTQVRTFQISLLKVFIKKQYHHRVPRIKIPLGKIFYRLQSLSESKNFVFQKKIFTNNETVKNFCSIVCKRIF